MSHNRSPFNPESLDHSAHGQHILPEEHVTASSKVEKLEKASSDSLVDLIDDVAPHLVQSFICMRTWWKKHHGLPETHVGYLSADRVCGTFFADHLLDV